MNPKIDAYLAKTARWQAEIKKLRKIILSCQLTEEMKWGKPCYTFQKKNVVIIIPLKDRCALAFCKGALLKDRNAVLTNIGEHSQAARWMKFSSVREIVEMESILKAYINEAIEAEKAGLEVPYKKTEDFKVPEELQKKLDQIPAFKTAFEALTPGRQRGYLLYFSAPKQSKTRASRIEKYVPQIFNGKGLMDEYNSMRKKRAR